MKREYLHCIVNMVSGQQIINNLKMSEAYLIAKLSKSGQTRESKVKNVIVTHVECSKEAYKQIFGN